MIFPLCSVQRDSISQLAQLDLCTADCTVRNTPSMTHNSESHHSKCWPQSSASFIGRHCHRVACDFLPGRVPPAADGDVVESQWSAACTGEPLTRSGAQWLVGARFLFLAVVLSVAAETCCVWACEDSWFSPHCCTVPAVRHVAFFIHVCLCSSVWLFHLVVFFTWASFSAALQTFIRFTSSFLRLSTLKATTLTTIWCVLVDPCGFALPVCVTAAHFSLSMMKIHGVLCVEVAIYFLFLCSGTGWCASF